LLIFDFGWLDSIITALTRTASNAQLLFTRYSLLVAIRHSAFRTEGSLMDPLTTAVTTILGKYAIDKGATLIKEAGQAAANVAAKLFEKVLGRLRASPADKKNAERFEQNPEGYKAPIADALDEQMKSDPDFAAELKQLLEEFEQARSVAPTQVVSASSGGIAAGRAAAGAQGIAIGGKVTDSAKVSVENISNDYSQVTNRTGGIDIQDSTVDVGGDMTGRDKISDK
jgi:hypothetical protein